MWINSLGIEGLYVNDLYMDIADCQGLLKTIDAVQPGIVSWKSVNKPKGDKALSKFKTVENANYAVVLCKQLNFSMVNCGGVDLVDGNQKIFLAIMAQLMRQHFVNLLSRLSSAGGTIDEAAVIAWANGKVEASGKASQIRDFRDKAISRGVFLIDLCAAINPDAVEAELVLAGDTPEECLLNAKYVISLARKVGASVFCSPDDIIE